MGVHEGRVTRPNPPYLPPHVPERQMPPLEAALDADLRVVSLAKHGTLSDGDGDRSLPADWYGSATTTSLMGDDS